MSKLDFELSGIVADLNTRAYRHSLLSANIANADTPGYHAKDLNFKEALNAAMSNKNVNYGQFEQYRTPATQSVDGNTVDLNFERSAMMDNALKYELSLMRTSHYFQMLQTAIKG